MIDIKGKDEKIITKNPLRYRLEFKERMIENP